MLTRLKVKGFKSLRDAELDVPRMLVLLGPNAAGKSNFLEALQCLSGLVTQRSNADALDLPTIRGYPAEAFAFPPGGMKALMGTQEATFALEADIRPEHGGRSHTSGRGLRYRVEVGLKPDTGALSTRDEYLTELKVRSDEPCGLPIVELHKDRFYVRTRGQGGHPTYEHRGLNHTTVSVPAYAGRRYPAIETLRAELSAWRAYYLDPRTAMRQSRPPSEETDIGSKGEHIAPYLYRLKTQSPRVFSAVGKALRTIIPSVQHLDVGLNRERGELEMTIVQDGITYSTRVISEGTLRVLALCALCVSPTPPSLIAFEEPENGVHPRRLDLLAEMLVSLAAEHKTQVIVTTHSPRFCNAVWKLIPSIDEPIALVAVQRRDQRTIFQPFDPAGPLFQQQEIMDALKSPTEDGVFEALLMRGYIDG